MIMINTTLVILTPVRDIMIIIMIIILIILIIIILIIITPVGDRRCAQALRVKAVNQCEILMR